MTNATQQPEPAWLTTARSYLGVREYNEHRPGPAGELSNPLIEKWQKLAGIRRPDDEIPWCAAFVTGVMHEAGHTEFASSAAKAWARYGKPCTPRIGAIVVLWREQPSGPHGHVGFYVGEGVKPGTVRLLAGNSGNAVTIHDYPTSRVLAYRWPLP